MAAATAVASATHARRGTAAGGRDARDADSGRPAGRAAAPRRDADGFEEVVYSANRRRRVEEANAGDGGRMDDATGQEEHWQAAGAGPGGDGAADGAIMEECLSDVDADDADDAHQEMEEDDPAELRRRMEREQATVRALIREGLDGEHPAMAAAVAARDAAEGAWRSTRKPHPVARRMGWAQRRLDRATRARDKVREDLALFDSQAKEQRDQIVERLGQAMDRVSKCQQALDDLQDEAATEAPCSRRGNGTAEVCSRLAGGMRNAVAPHVAALASQLADGSAAQEHFNLLVAQLEGLQGELDEHARAKDGDAGHEEYYIADDRSDAEWSESHDVPGDGVRGGDVGTEAQGDQADLPRWRSKGHGRWNKDGSDMGWRSGKGTGQAVGLPAPATPTAAAANAPLCNARSSGQQRESAKACGDGAKSAPPAPPGQRKPGAGGAARGNCDGDSAPPPNKLHKGQSQADSEDARAAASDTNRAMELMQAQQGAAAAGEFGSQAAVQAAARLHSQNVAKVVNAAIAQGVQPVTPAGEELIMLGPQELQQWATANLDREQGTWW